MCWHSRPRPPPLDQGTGPKAHLLTPTPHIPCVLRVSGPTDLTWRVCPYGSPLPPTPCSWLRDYQHLRYMWVPHTDTVVVVRSNPKGHPLADKALAEAGAAAAGASDPEPATRLKPMRGEGLGGQAVELWRPEYLALIV